MTEVVQYLDSLVTIINSKIDAPLQGWHANVDLKLVLSTYTAL
ncbi:13028_t:CDS:2 [Cetraspora pellucida]|uniref:13028_t:CDS:1 n=1 Tax=Cetraspora pellucida TaxID=1433469 RepID=A0A9N8W327_9GLOM|nr:13028_t:CDS:2 [Cetraspora pellucida]